MIHRLIFHCHINFYISTGGLSWSFQGDSFSEPALVHQYRHGHHTSLPQAEAQGKGEPPADDRHMHEILSTGVSQS